MSKQQYTKPPVVEKMIEIIFQPSVARGIWDEEAAKPFFEKIKEDYPDQESFYNVEVTVTSEGPKSGKPRLEKIRYFNAPASEAVQLFQNRLVMNFLKKDGNVVDFENMLPRFSKILKIYNDCYEPRYIENVGLMYKNLVTINPSGQTLEFKDYFTMLFQIPLAQKDSVSRFQHRVEFVQKEEGRIAQINFHGGVAKELNFEECKFFIDFAAKYGFLNQKICAEETLVKANKFLNEVFEESFTERTKNEVFGKTEN